MAYVSAQYMPPGPLPTPPGAPKQIQAVDEQGLIWSFTEDSQVGDWVRYIEGGGTIDPAPANVAASNVPPPGAMRDIPAEIDALTARVAALEGKKKR